MSLTPKQERFVQEYLLDSNGAGAYKRAGYKSKNDHVAAVEASKLLANPDILARVEAARQDRAKKLGLDAVWVLKQLRRNYRRAMQSEQVRDNEGSPTGEYRYEGNVANKALELIGKLQGLFVEQHKHKHGGDPDNPIRHATSVKIYIPDNGRGQPKQGGENE